MPAHLPPHMPCILLLLLSKGCRQHCRHMSHLRRRRALPWAEFCFFGTELQEKGRGLTGLDTRTHTAFIHLCSHARTHARTHAQTHAHTYTHTHHHPFILAPTYTHIHTHTHTHKHTHRNTYTPTHTHTHTPASKIP
jgi:hypothetical protein